jgi:hypothetical protein
VEAADRLTVVKRTFGLYSLFTSALFEHGDKCVELRISLLNPRETLIDDINRRCLSLPYCGH